MITNLQNYQLSGADDWTNFKTDAASVGLATLSNLVNGLTNKYFAVNTPASEKALAAQQLIEVKDEITRRIMLYGGIAIAAGVVLFVVLKKKR